MKAAEQAVTFDAENARLVGLLHAPETAQSRGVLVVVGGPQYRVGSHRQFVLLARRLAAAGIPVFRFDYRGMGDSDEPVIDFEQAGPDIRAALDEFFRRIPDLKEVVLWGLCDAAAASAMYAPHDGRVTGLVLLNPWVRQPDSAARTYLRHYYGSRVMDIAQWKRLLTGQIDVGRSLREIASKVFAGVRGWVSASASAERSSFVDRMLAGLDRFDGRVLLILSGADLTAAEFKDVVAGSADWRRVLAKRRVARYDLPEANHTFSTREWRQRVEKRTMEFALSI